MSSVVLKRVNSVVHRRVAGETVLIPVRSKLVDLERVFVLNGVGDFIWERLDGHTTLGRIEALIVEEFDVPRKDASADLQAFAEELLRRGLVLGEG